MKKIILTLSLLAYGPFSAATTITFTDEASFLSYLSPSYYLEDFSSYTYGDPSLGAMQNFGPVNGYSWTASTPGGLWANNSALSTNFAEALLNISFTGNTVTALGGVISSTDIDGYLIPRLISISLNDGTKHSLIGEGFVGFVSDSAIDSLIIDPSSFLNDNFAQLDHFYVGSQKASVPEPTLIALLGLGIAGLGLSRIRDRDRAKRSEI